jgi:hypothetical protein
VPRQVEEIFENYLPLLDLYVNGRTIRTTAEHPFWVRDRGWVAAHQLEAGDELRAHDGRWLKVDGLEGPKASETVYNMCVADYHTYFIGDQIWGFAVWSHNMGLCSKTGKTAPNKQVKDLPSLDSTGKVHGELPRPKDLGNYSAQDLRNLKDELMQSVQERIRKTEQLGRDRSHGQRQGAEQDLIEAIVKYLSGS